MARAAYGVIPCSAVSNDPTSEIEMTTTGGTILRFDFSSMQFIYNWQTPKTAGTCHRMDVTFTDGTTRARTSS